METLKDLKAILREWDYMCKIVCTSSNGGRPIKYNPRLISTDAAKGRNAGWGAHYGEISTGGPWSPEERKKHINILELKAVYLGITTFLKDISR